MIRKLSIPVISSMATLIPVAAIGGELPIASTSPANQSSWHIRFSKYYDKIRLPSPQSTSYSIEDVKESSHLPTDLNLLLPLSPELNDRNNKVATVAAADHRETANGRGKGKKKRENSRETILSNNGNGVQQNREMVSGQYNLPLVWIDLEMTGLDVEVDRILEIACVITDGHLTKVIEGPDLVIHQSKECLDRMGEWCQSHHGASGLTEKVLQSTISEQEAEKQEEVASHTKAYSCK
ncbi:hypothetical protein F0562_002171 [Nyssa sinensis]|uniref:Exonuclease domain-containing protein n=1 Tax=Nyssa sinensis TaxID=561372 RepID=A0A5J5C8Z5_9ASTE|nr:hypothetical protein F0562_002171 [Nyssa sinensis]